MRVDELALVSDVYTALYSQSGGTVGRDAAYASDGNRLQLSPFSLANGTYDVRVLGLASQGGATIAVPIEGPMVVGP